MIENLIVYQDQDLLIIDKPSQMHSVKNRLNQKKNTLADLLARYLPELASVTSKATLECGLVQRLDFETSGLLIVAKNSASWQFLHKQILAGKIKKSYIVLLEGELNKSVSLHGWLSQRYRGSKKVEFNYEEVKRSQSAEIDLECIRIIKNSAGKVATLAKAYASPAHRHQVRVMSTALGHPLVGDKTYHAKLSLNDFKDQLELNLERGFLLHAFNLDFLQLKNNKRLSFSSLRV
jgi:23S rRNA pseudouridine1911/1915/1917 synthase